MEYIFIFFVTLPRIFISVICNFVDNMLIQICILE